MTSAIVFRPETIVIKSRGVLEFLSFGRWQRICTVDLRRQAVEEATLRLTKTTTCTHSLRVFDAVDFSYVSLGSTTRDGVEYDADEYRVGLRFSSSGKVFPLAVFHGSTQTPVGMGEVVASIFPSLWNNAPVTHEVAARSFANRLCEILDLKLAI